MKSAFTDITTTYLKYDGDTTPTQEDTIRWANMKDNFLMQLEEIYASSGVNLTNGSSFFVKDTLQTNV